MVSPAKDTDIQWIKFGDVDSISFIGKDTVVLGFGNYILFYDTSRPEKKELIYRATTDVRGDGVQCLCTHRSLSCFAMAEKCRNPRILINSYPTFENMKTIDAIQESAYLALRFSDMEYLVALTAEPYFNIIMWNWRTLEKLFCQDTKVCVPKQILRVSYTSPIQIVQSVPEERILIIWDMNMCYKKPVLNRNQIMVPEKSQPPYSYCWGYDGDLYFSDSRGNLFSVGADTRSCELILAWRGEEGQCTPCLTWYKGGWVFTGPSIVQYCRRKSPEGWSKIWSYTPPIPLKNLISSAMKDLLYGWNEMHELVLFKGEPNVECITTRSYGCNFDFICFLQPMGDVFITYGKKQTSFKLWNKTSGVMVASMEWNKLGIVNDVKSNPCYPYVVVIQSTGRIYAINMYDLTYLMILCDIYLTTNSLDTVRFNPAGTRFCVANIEIGELFLIQIQDSKMEVVATTKLDLKIVDFILVGESAVQNLIILPMSQLCCRSGQSVLLYTSNKKTFHLVAEVSMPNVITSIMLKNENELFCVPHRSRIIQVIEIANGTVTGKKVTGHQMKIYSMRSCGKLLITFGFDGLAIVRSNDLKCITVVMPHHRMTKGIKDAIVDPYCNSIITLGVDGTLVCFTYSGTWMNRAIRNEYENLLKSNPYKQMLYAPLVSAKAKAKALEKFLAQANSHRDETVGGEVMRPVTEKTWLEIREQEKINHDQAHSQDERDAILEELESIRQELKELLDANSEVSEHEKLPINAFDLDKTNRRKRIEDAKAEREKEKYMQLATIKARDKVSDYIKKVCWDSVCVKGREIHGIVSPITVESYPLLEVPEKWKIDEHWRLERLKLEQYYRKGDYFEPWVPRSASMLELHLSSKTHLSDMNVAQTVKTKFEEDELEDQNKESDGQEKDSSHLWSGTASYNFIEVNPYHYNQFESTGYTHGMTEISLIMEDIRNLMVWFNKQFEEVYQIKESQVAAIVEKNNRFRHIINELNFFHFSPEICKIVIVDPEWSPYEQPDRIVKVADSELTVSPYISSSEQELIDKKEAEAKRIRQLLMSDDFKEKALLVMMDGVLEKLWENELKKDVPKPKCMLEKEPESFTDDDLKAIKIYEEQVRFLQSERERYRKILEGDWGKIHNSVREIVNRFDNRLAKLQLLKMKVESAICQETLKLLRLRLKMLGKWEMNRKECSIKEEMAKNEKKILAMNTELSSLQDAVNECKGYYESLQTRDRTLDKNFKKEFPDLSPVICEQLYKLSKKRPKLLQKAALYSTLLIDLGKCVVAGTKPDYLTGECIQYLKDIDALDNNVNAPAAINDQTWDLMCKMRRTKIECELKIRACAVDLGEAEATLSAYQKKLKTTSQHQSQLFNELQNIRQEKLIKDQNFDIQLVLKSGLVEIPLSGSISDFEECILVSRDTLTEINSIIEKAGNKKIREMIKAADFRKGIIFKEWEHKKLRMEIEDLQSMLNAVESVKVTKELQSILVARARVFNEEKGILYLEDEINTVKENYVKNEKELNRKIEEFNMKIDKLSNKNEELDSRIAELNIDVNELNKEIDNEFEEKQLTNSMKRMKKVRYRCKLVQKIREQHNEILMLQTELELLRLRTFPTLKNKV